MRKLPFVSHNHTHVYASTYISKFQIYFCIGVLLSIYTRVYVRIQTPLYQLTFSTHFLYAYFFLLSPTPSSLPHSTFWMKIAYFFLNVQLSEALKMEFHFIPILPHFKVFPHTHTHIALHVHTYNRICMWNA